MVLLVEIHNFTLEGFTYLVQYYYWKCCMFTMPAIYCGVATRGLVTSITTYKPGIFFDPVAGARDSGVGRARTTRMSCFRCFGAELEAEAKKRQCLAPPPRRQEHARSGGTLGLRIRRSLAGSWDFLR